MATDAAIGPGSLPVLSDAGSVRLRVVAFTSGPLLPVNRVFFERLGHDPLLDVRAILVDESTEGRAPTLRRVFRGFREGGWRWMAFKINSTWNVVIEKMVRSFFELTHGRTEFQECYATLERKTGIPVYRMNGIHGDQGLSLIRVLQPQLGVIVGNCHLSGTVLSIPEHGTLTVEKRWIPEDGHGGRIRNWHSRAREGPISVAIRSATPGRQSGAVLTEATIPAEECDTVESLEIKADLLGAKLYHETIRQVARENHLIAGAPGEPVRERAPRASTDYGVWQLQRDLRDHARKRMPLLRARPSYAARLRVFIQYAILLPRLLYLKNRFRSRRRAPICILFYHVVANRPVNHLCLPLEHFVKQIEFLRCHYRVVSLDEAVERLSSGRNEEITVSITFDDGYRDNVWAIEYLRYFGIPAAFFVSIGHVRDGSAFEHDRRAGFEDALPMREADLQRLVSEGFVIGSHGLYHEDFGRLDPAAAEQALRESRELIAKVSPSGQVPQHFSFPTGKRGINITPGSFALAARYYPYLYSAYGGYNFPARGRRHFLRVGHPIDVLELSMMMNGYTGFRLGDSWGVRTDSLLPY